MIIAGVNLVSTSALSFHQSGAERVKVLESGFQWQSQEDENQNKRSKGATLPNQMDNLEVAFLITIWDTILRRFQNVSEYL